MRKTRLPNSHPSTIPGVTVGRIRSAANNKTYGDRALARLFLALEENRGCRLSAEEVEDILMHDEAIQARLYQNLPEETP